MDVVDGLGVGVMWKRQACKPQHAFAGACLRLFGIGYGRQGDARNGKHKQRQHGAAHASDASATVDNVVVAASTTVQRHAHE